ncbi:hypothetical protein ACHQM5_003309 [Ranunculus cassubicifolius]
MDSTPSSKSTSHLVETDDFNNNKEQAPILNLIPDSPTKTPLSSPQQKLIPLRDLLLLSPSPQRRSKSRLIERPELAEEPGELVVPRRRCKSRASPMGVLGCASPRNNRRHRRRLDNQGDEKEVALGDEIVKPRKKRQPGRPRKEKLGSVPPPPPPSSSSPKTGEIDQSSLDHAWKMINDLIMWKDAAKSTLWFGFGSMCFLSSCFTNGLRWSIFSMISQMGLIFLAVSFFYNSVSKRNKDGPKIEFKLKEEDIVRVSRVFLPTANLVIAKTTKIFSGDPSTTLKVAPLLLFGAEYGHLITLWRLCAIGFFISFTVPRLFSCYSVQINRKVEYLKNCVWDAWGACSHKKVVAVSAALVFWNLSSVKTRFFTAFITAVILRYRRQKSETVVVEVEEDGQTQQQEQQQALVVVEDGSIA